MCPFRSPKQVENKKSVLPTLAPSVWRKVLPFVASVEEDFENKHTEATRGAILELNFHSFYFHLKF